MKRLSRLLYVFILCSLFSCKAIKEFINPDADSDGIYDRNDACPEVAGIFEFNGCPDSDGDGIPDSKDACPTSAGDITLGGCPDADGDNIKDSEDACPNEAGSRANNGCPFRDADGDGILDKDDECPEIAGIVGNNGCPEEVILPSMGDFPYFDLTNNQPSGTEELSKNYFENAKNWSDVKEVLTSALDKAGYAQKNYYYVENGFAIATQTEQTDKNGISLEGRDRWIVDKIYNHKEHYSILERILAIGEKHKGYYRSFVFVVSPNPYKDNSNLENTPMETVKEWAINGAPVLPSAIGKNLYTESHSVTVFIYEYEISENDLRATQNIPSLFPGKQMELSGILDKLKL